MSDKSCRTMRLVASASALCLLLTGCAQTPMGPTVQVMPGQGKSFEAFQADHAECAGYAAGQVKGQAELANQQAVGTAALGLLLGAGLGAAVGGIGGRAGAGAGVGAASGALLGAGLGAQNSTMTQMGIQRRYDIAFAQCMYAKGQVLPGFAPPAAPATAGVADAVTGAIAGVPRAGGGPETTLVRATQSELIRLRYLDDGADGVMGAKTGSAIMAYEQASGLPASGQPTPALLARLQATPGTGAPAMSAAPSWVVPSTQAAPVSSGLTQAGAASDAPAAAAPGWVQPAVAKP